MSRQNVVLAISALLFVTPAVYAQKIYWTDGASDIWRANLDGSDKELLGNWANSPHGPGTMPFLVDDVTGKICWFFDLNPSAPHGLYCANPDFTDTALAVPKDWNNTRVISFALFSPPPSTVPSYSDWSFVGLAVIILVAATLTIRSRQASAERG